MTQNCPGKWGGLQSRMHTCILQEGRAPREWFQAIWLPQGSGVRASSNNVQLHWCLVFDEKDHLQLLAALGHILALENQWEQCY